jgi:hypothetical protein
MANVDDVEIAYGRLASMRPTILCTKSRNNNQSASAIGTVPAWRRRLVAQLVSNPAISSIQIVAPGAARMSLMRADALNDVHSLAPCRRQSGGVQAYQGPTLKQ